MSRVIGRFQFFILSFRVWFRVYDHLLILLRSKTLTVAIPHWLAISDPPKVELTTSLQKSISLQIINARSLQPKQKTPAELRFSHA